MTPKTPFYYGYIVLAVSIIIMTVVWGTYLSYGIFFDSLLLDFNWSRAITSGAFSLSTIVSGFLGIITGRLCDKLGPKAITLFITATIGLGFILLSLINSPWQLYLIYAIPMSCGVAGTWAPLVSTVARWFEERRGLMIGLVASGIGLGGIVFAPIISQIVQVYDWRNTSIIIGVLALVVITVSSRFLRQNPKQPVLATPSKNTKPQTEPVGERSITFKKALFTRQYWIIAAMFMLFGFGQVTVMVHIVPYAGVLGISPIAAATNLSIIGASSIFGRIILGFTCDKIKIRSSLIINLAIYFLAFVGLNFAGSLWALYLFSAFFGFAWGGMSSLQSLASVEHFGLSSLGALVGSFSFAFCIGGTFGPTVAGYIFDVSGSYNMAFILCTITSLGALISAACLTPPRTEAAT